MNPAEEQKFIDSCYNLGRGMTRVLDRPLKGYRVESVSQFGQVGPFDRNGETGIAGCDPRFYKYVNPILGQDQLKKMMAEKPAITHDPNCTHCGHRIVRSPRELAEYILAVAKSGVTESTFMNHERANKLGLWFAISECFVPAGGTIAHRSPTYSELPGTLRADRLQLGSRVHMPRTFGGRDQMQASMYVRWSHPGVRVELPRLDDLSMISNYLPAGTPWLKSVLAKGQNR